MNVFCHTVSYMLHICHQLEVSFHADSNSWNVNGTQNLRTEADAQCIESAGF